MSARLTLAFFVLGAVAACGSAKEADAAGTSAPAQAAAPSGETAAIPDAFRGLWAGSRAECNSASSDSKLTIGTTQLDFYESTHAVTSLKAAGPDAIAVTTAGEGEGEKWAGAFKLKLAAGGQQLSVESEGTSFVRVRCGPAAKS